MRFFNTAGPIQWERHYFLDPLSRVDFEDLKMLIHQQKYFVLHAPRQTGKTSILLALRDYLNRGDDFRCVYVNVEPAQAFREDIDRAMLAIISSLNKMAQRFELETHIDSPSDFVAQYGSGDALGVILKNLAESIDVPLVLLLDEIDSLVGDTLISVLRQLRAGYADRPARFPASVILCGVRDVRDYRIHASSEKEPVTGGSAFNIKAESLRIGDFDRHQTFTLLGQHTEATGQVFEEAALERIWNESQGQPWLVNALAYEVTFRMKANRDPDITITEAMIIEAREALIQRRETHLDQLGDKLREPRIHNVIAPLLAGSDQTTNLRDDDISYAVDLGLVKAHPQLTIANPIYREVIPRMLTYPIQVTIAQETNWYIAEDTGLIDMAKLLKHFQQFFREHSEYWTERFNYKEAGAQLLLQAFLQRIINGGGRIEREYGLGRGRTDLLIIIPHKTGVQRIVLELKILHGSRETTIEKGLAQVTAYMDRCGADEGHLILFDRSERSWDEKIFNHDLDHDGLTIQVWGM